MGLWRGEDTAGVDDNAAAADHGHATRISSPLRKRGNRQPGAGEGLPLCMGSLVATLLELLCTSADRMGYWSAIDVHQYLKESVEDGARLRIDAGSCLHVHELERCDADGCFGIRDDAFYVRRD